MGKTVVDYSAIVADYHAGVAMCDVAAKHRCDTGTVRHVIRAYLAAKAGNYEYFKGPNICRRPALCDWASQFFPNSVPEEKNSTEKMTFEEAIRLLVQQYEKDIKPGWVKDPVAHALYEVWKEADKRGKSL